MPNFAKVLEGKPGNPAQGRLFPAADHLFNLSKLCPRTRSAVPVFHCLRKLKKRRCRRGFSGTEDSGRSGETLNTSRGCCKSFARRRFGKFPADDDSGLRKGKIFPGPPDRRAKGGGSGIREDGDSRGVWSTGTWESPAISLIAALFTRMGIKLPAWTSTEPARKLYGLAGWTLRAPREIVRERLVEGEAPGMSGVKCREGSTLFPAGTI